jgi:putative PEP-CTERM system histidine kinase
VTGILDQPIIVIESNRRFLFLNTLISNVVVLLAFDTTLRNASRSQLESVKFIFVAYLGFVVYFAYVSFNVLASSTISQSLLHSGVAVISLGLGFLTYAFAKYPFWEVKIRVSRRMVFGSLTITAVITYLIISGSILDLLRFVQPVGYETLFPATVFTLVATFLVVYLSPNLKRSVECFLTRNFFRNKYDYRDLWMKFSEKSSGSLNVTDVLPRVAEFIADAMFVRPVAIWLPPSAASTTFTLAYCHGPGTLTASASPALRVTRDLTPRDFHAIHVVPEPNDDFSEKQFPVDNVPALNEMGIKRLAFVQRGNSVLALLGIGHDISHRAPSTEDDRLLSSISTQLGHSILNHKLSEELLLAHEWESFNRFASFVVHDLKNLATLQSMTLENAKRLSHNPAFVADAFATFAQTTDKMINVIASLSVQRGQFSLKQQPVNILQILTHTFDELKLHQRHGLELRTIFPPTEKPPLIAGDPELLKKAFTNLLLNAMQSLPKGQGAVEVTVSEPRNGKITAEIKDSGCGIPPEQLTQLFRPFQTTKKQGMGIGLCHTRSIVEVHGGNIRIESRVNTGTKVELEFPTL